MRLAILSVAFLCGVYYLFGAEPVRQNYDDPVAVRDEFSKVYDTFHEEMTLLQSTPTVGDLTEQVPVLVSTMNVTHIMVRIDNLLYKWELKLSTK